MLPAGADLRKATFIYCRGGTLFRAAKASIGITVEGPRPRLTSTETLLRLLLPLNDQV